MSTLSVQVWEDYYYPCSYLNRWDPKPKILEHESEIINLILNKDHEGLAKFLLEIDVIPEMDYRYYENLQFDFGQRTVEVTFEEYDGHGHYDGLAAMDIYIND